MRFVQARLAGFPEEVVMPRYFQFLQREVANAAEIMRSYIEGHNFGDKNGPGRVKTGKMRDSVKWEGRKDGKGIYRFRLGWLDGTPGYAIFQEQGTRNGVIAMNALGYTMDFLRTEIRLLGVSSKGFRATKASKFNPEKDG